MLSLHHALSSPSPISIHRLKAENHIIYFFYHTLYCQERTLKITNPEHKFVKRIND